MIHLRSISLKPGAKKTDAFPFNLPLIKTFRPIEFHSPVTFLVGENGSGKSTLLEAIAAGIGLIAVGAEDLPQDRTLAHARQLGEQLRYIWQKKTRRGFFLRAEDFFNFAKRIKRMTEELEELAASYEQEFTGYALGLAKGTAPETA